MNIVERFSNHLIQVEYPTKQEHWNIAGILKNKSNQHLKFDVRGMSRLPEGLLSKRGYTATKADKMVFETDKEWIILDIPEIHKYLKRRKKRVIYLDNLIEELEWSMYLPK